MVDNEFKIQIQTRIQNLLLPLSQVIRLDESESDLFLNYSVSPSLLNGFTEQANSQLIGDPRNLWFNVLIREDQPFTDVSTKAARSPQLFSGIEWRSHQGLDTAPPRLGR